MSLFANDRLHPFNDELYLPVVVIAIPNRAQVACLCDAISGGLVR